MTWTSDGQDGDGYGIYAQRYDASGSATGVEFQVNSTIAGSQDTSAVTALNNGGFVVTWQSDGTDGDSYGIYAQRYDAGGNAAGGEFKVNTIVTGAQVWSAVAALDNGVFVVTWASGEDGSGASIHAQRYDANGNPAGTAFQVNTTTFNSQFLPAITTLVDGGFVVNWKSYLQDGSNYGIYVQRYDASGNAVGGELQVNTTTVDDQENSAISALADGGFVVTWES